MAKSTKYGLLGVLSFFALAITCGGLGYAAWEYDAFYWLPFVLNFGVYGWAVYKNFKKTEED